MVTHDDREDRPAILMIHGFTGSPDELRGVARIAFDAGFRDLERLSKDPALDPLRSRADFRDT